MNNSDRFDCLCIRLLAHVSSADSLSTSRIDFADLCHKEGISPVTADNLFYSRFGLSAERLIEHIGLLK